MALFRHFSPFLGLKPGPGPEKKSYGPSLDPTETFFHWITGAWLEEAAVALHFFHLVSLTSAFLI